MDVPPEHVPAYRKAFRLLLEADSRAEAEQGFGGIDGDELAWGSSRVFLTDVRAVEGEVIDPASYEGDGLPLYPGRATVVVTTDSLSEAEAVFSALDGTVTEDDMGRELSLELIDGPVEEGTMPAPPDVTSLPPVAISRQAWAFILEHGGSVWVWTKPFGRGWSSLHASTARPAGIAFEPHQAPEAGEGVSVFLEEGLVATELVVRLRPFPHAKLTVSGPTSFGTA